ncbi:hypothetical protein [Caulobacter sp. NIBR2454]|uniref:hypothetical protein n=1 Tax=Caulobacter sp. NIBR2454 TaxID=3015996 RepID=UPI0022B6E8D8|nr:hypothetical protein [Caulobacter sp. NIBR2454]
MNTKLAALAAVLAVAPLMAGCVMIDAKDNPDVRISVDGDPSLERLIAFVVTRDSVMARVNSNGCTSKADFGTVVRKDGTRARVSLTRKREDNCRALVASTADLTWTYAELGLEPGGEVRILNPFAGR